MNEFEESMKRYFATANHEQTDECSFQANQHQPQTMHRVGKNEYDQYTMRSMADGTVSDLSEFISLIKKLVNAAWGTNDIDVSMNLKQGDDSESIKLPQIVVDVNERDIGEGMPLKPKLIDTVQEIDDAGNPTGDVFLVYRQWFDYNIEFDIYGKTATQAYEFMRKLESLLTVYAGYLKRQGVSEIIFEKEVPAKFSLNYNEKAVMRCIYYYVRLENFTVVRQSKINNINKVIGVGELNIEKVNQAVSKQEQSDDTFDFFFMNDDTTTYDIN